MSFTNLGLGGRGELKSDINVTPLLAVMLVLVVNLMLFVPPSGDGSGFRLPRATNTVDKPNPHTHEVTVVTVGGSRTLYLNRVMIREKDLAQRLSESLEGKRDKTVLFEADEDTPYSAIMAAMDSLREAQIENISLAVKATPK